MKFPSKNSGWLEVQGLIIGGARAYHIQVEYNATSWSNLQDCKSSSIAEIPKLDRVWQKLMLSKPNVTQLNSTQPKATVKATSLG